MDINNETVTVELEVPLSLYEQIGCLFSKEHKNKDQHFDKQLLLEILLTKTLFNALRSQREAKLSNKVITQQYRSQYE